MRIYQGEEQYFAATVAEVCSFGLFFVQYKSLPLPVSHDGGNHCQLVPFQKMFQLSFALVPLLAIHGIAGPPNQYGGQNGVACQQAVSQRSKHVHLRARADYSDSARNFGPFSRPALPMPIPQPIPTGPAKFKRFSLRASSLLPTRPRSPRSSRSRRRMNANSPFAVVATPAFPVRTISRTAWSSISLACAKLLSRVINKAYVWARGIGGAMSTVG